MTLMGKIFTVYDEVVGRNGRNENIFLPRN